MVVFTGFLKCQVRVCLIEMSFGVPLRVEEKQQVFVGSSIIPAFRFEAFFR